MHLVIIGPPGAGKGTQGAELAGVLGVPHVSTGDMFRHHVSRRTELGRSAAASMEAGEYVPDAITTQMLRERLRADDARAGFVLDGYPRTPSQVLALDALLAEQGVNLTSVIELQLDEEVAARRLLARAEGRADDSEDVIRHRMMVYRRETAPILETYVARGVMLQVDAAGPVETVRERVLAALPSGCH